MSVPQEEIQVLSEWAMPVPPSLALSLAVSGGLFILTAVGSGAGGQAASLGYGALPKRLGEISDWIPTPSPWGGVGGRRPHFPEWGFG